MIVGLAGALCACGSGQPSQETLVRFGQQCLAVPKRYAAAIDASPMFPFLAEESSDNYLRLIFTARELTSGMITGADRAVDPPKDEMVVAVTLASAEDLRRIDYKADSFGYDIWYGHGDYRVRSVRPGPSPGLLRIRPLGGEANSWMVVTRSPDEAAQVHKQRNFWIGSCYEVDWRPGATCISDVAVPERSVIVTLHVLENYLPFRDAMAQRILLAMDSWRRTDC
jgi:hypothetical protein